MKKWTEENNKILLNKYHSNVPILDISKFFNTTEIAIRCHIRRLGIVKYKHFNESELILLKQLYPIKTYEELSLIFNRTIPAIQYQVKKMENYGKRIIKLKPEYFENIKNKLLSGLRIVDIAKEYNVAQSTLTQFCLKNGLNPTDLYTYEMLNKHRLKANSGFLKLLNVYKSNCKRNDVDFLLTDEEFQKLTSSNCFYCNIEPSKISISKSGKSDYKYNGIDKKDPEIGYIFDNCVPCCWDCNKLKSNYTFDEFKSLISKIYKNLNKAESRKYKIQQRLK